MRLIFITREGYNLPGARIRCYNFARELSGHGISTEVLSFSDNLGAQDGANESKMGLREKLSYNYRVFNRLKREKGSILYIQRFNYHSIAPFFSHLINRNRIILDLDDWEMREDPKYYFNIFPSSKAHYITTWIARRSMFCVAASRYLQGFLSQFNREVCYVPSGVDTALFSPSVNTHDNGRTVFCWSGTLHRKEYIDNISLALDCFCNLRKKYRNIYFDIAADGIYRDLLLKNLKILSDPNIRFKGWLHPDLMPDYLGSIDVGLMPVASEVKFNLAKSPTKLFEYMAKAKPSICSGTGEALNIITDGKNGLLASGNKEFEEKMEKLINNPDLRIRLGQEALKTVGAEYSLQILSKRLYERLKVC